MATCTHCNAEVAPSETFYSRTGDLVCKRCHFAGETSVMEQRARESLERDAPEGLKVSASGTPQSSIKAGAILLAVGALWLAVDLFVLDRWQLYPFLLMGSGGLALGSGLSQRR